MSVGKASIKRAANAETKKTSVKQKAGTDSGNVKKSIVNPVNTEELQVVFLKEKDAKETGRTNQPVRITEELPEYLL